MIQFENLTNLKQNNSKFYKIILIFCLVGGCDWFGRGPVCAGVCPIGYEEIRKQKEAHCGQSKHNSPSHCFGGCDTIADQNFGSNCWNPGGVKRWCCL